MILPGYSHLVYFIENLLLPIWVDVLSILVWVLDGTWLLQRWIDTILIWRGIEFIFFSCNRLSHLLHLLLSLLHSLFPFLYSFFGCNQLVSVLEQNVGEEKFHREWVSDSHEDKHNEILANEQCTFIQCRAICEFAIFLHLFTILVGIVHFEESEDNECRDYDFQDKSNYIRKCKESSHAHTCPEEGSDYEADHHSQCYQYVPYILLCKCSQKFNDCWTKDNDDSNVEWHAEAASVFLWIHD